MNITGEQITLFIIAMCAILGGFAWILNKLERIQEQISAIREDRVSHNVCAERRKECPCGKELNMLRTSELKLYLEKGGKK